MYTLFQWWTSWTYILHSFTLCNKFNHMIIWDVEEAYHMNCLTLLLNKGVTGCSCINWRDTTHFDSEDDYRTGCRNISHCQQQQSYSGLRSPGRSNSTFWNYMRNNKKSSKSSLFLKQMAINWKLNNCS